MTVDEKQLPNLYYNIERGARQGRGVTAVHLLTTVIRVLAFVDMLAVTQLLIQLRIQAVFH